MKKSLFILSFLLSLIIFSSDVLALNVGDPVTVEWKGGWYPATVLQISGDKYFIHYQGYNNSWDEWVTSSRIKELAGAPAPARSAFNAGDPVMVNWKGSWWNAHVMQAEPNRWYIKYDGYDSSWNEWVDASRIKRR